MTPAKGFILGAAIGVIFCGAIGLYCIYDFHHVEARPDRYAWACHTDTECEAEAQRKGLIDRD